MASHVKINREKKSHYAGADGGLGNRLGAAQAVKKKRIWKKPRASAKTGAVLKGPRL